MIDPTRTPGAQTTELGRDERSMRIFEYGLAMIALVSAILLSLR
jgi:hypothetical protein